MEQRQIEITLWREIYDHQVFIKLTNDLLSVSWWTELRTLDAWKWEPPSLLAFSRVSALAEVHGVLADWSMVQRELVEGIKDALTGVLDKQIPCMSLKLMFFSYVL